MNWREITVCKTGDYWFLEIKRPEVTPISLPQHYNSEADAVAAAYKFIRNRKVSHPGESWSCDR